LRRGEALALRWSDIDLKRREARVTGSLVRQNSALVVSTPKTARSRRTVSLSASAVALLKSVKAAQAAERLKAANLWEDTGFVFTTEFGQPADPRNLLRAVTIAAKKAGLAGVGVHTLRHTAATTALLNGVPIHVVSRNLGHSSIAITADVYGHLTDEAAQAAADVVSVALGL
jgi:integrase